MAVQLLTRVAAVLLLLALLAGPAGLTRPAAAAEEEIKCANCGKMVKKSKAIKVIKNGQVYYVCSTECAKKLQNKK